MTAYRSPWQSPNVERIIGSIRLQCLNHVIVLSESHLRSILRDYFDYYHHARTCRWIETHRFRARSSCLNAAKCIRFRWSADCIIAIAARLECLNCFASVGDPRLLHAQPSQIGRPARQDGQRFTYARCCW